MSSLAGHRVKGARRSLEREPLLLPLAAAGRNLNLQADHSDGPNTSSNSFLSRCQPMPAPSFSTFQRKNPQDTIPIANTTTKPTNTQAAPKPFFFLEACSPR